MVSGTKFFIYGGGRWREVDINDGRVEGWGRARFGCTRRGKVQVAKTQAVLAGLRDLAAGQNSAVKDGAHLPCKMNEVMKEKNQESACDHSHCCHHSNNNNGCVQSKKKQISKINTGVQCISKTDAGIQTSLPSQTLTFPDMLNKRNSRKRRRETISSDEDIPSKITTNAVVYTNSPNKLPKLVSHKKWSVTISSEENDAVLQKKRVPSLKLNKVDSKKYDVYQRKRTNSSDSLVWVVLPKQKVNKAKLNSKQKTEYLKPKSKHTSNTLRNSPSSNISPKLRSHDRKATVGQINTKSRSNHTREKARETSVASSDEENGVDESKLNQQTDSNVYKTRQDQCKELIIDDKDVEILRNYLLYNASDFDLLKFDQDDEYKKRFFFKINPLVNVERCQKIARMLRGGSQDVISLRDFASQLGLRSISDLSSAPNRRRMRKSKELKNLRDDPGSETDKENSDTNLKSRTRKSSAKSSKQENIGKHENYSSSFSDSYTSSEHSEEYHNNRRISQRINKSLKESNRRPKIYETRLSRGNLNRSKLTEILSSNNNKARNFVDSSETEFFKSSKRVSGRSHNKVNRSENLDLTESSENDSDVVSKSVKPSANKINNIDLTESIDENSDVEYAKSSNKFRPTKTKNDKSNANIKEIKESKEKKSNEQKTNSSKEGNSRTKSKVNNDKNKAHKNVDENLVEEPKRKFQNKANANKNSENKRNKYLTDSNEENSDVEVPKTPKESTRRVQNTNIDKRNVNKIKDNSSNKESSDEEEPKLSKQPQRRDQNKITNKNKRIKKDLTDSDDENSELEVPKSSKESSRRGQSKDNKNKNIRNNIKRTDSTDEETKTSNETHGRAQNKANDGKTRVKNKYLQSSDKNLEEPRKKDRNNIQSERDGNKRYANEAKSKEISKVDRNKVKTTKSVSADKSDLNSDNEKEVFAKNGSVFPKPITKQVKVNSKHTISKRPSSSAAREYSNLEDHAIVTWLSVGGRATCVNGNRIWRELQEHYYKIAGQTRSWHSLRNRYLRYILPKLGTLALPPSQEARLRSAAAIGEIKSRKLASRRNSIFGAPLLGALSRRPGASRGSSSEPEPPPKRHKHDHTKKVTSPSPKRALRSGPPPSPARPRTSPRYSDITRHFTATHQQDESTPNTSPRPLSTKTLETKHSATKRLPSPNSSATEERMRKKTLSHESSSSKYLRRSFRSKDSTQQETEKSPEKERARTRKLFNPSAML